MAHAKSSDPATPPKFGTCTCAKWRIKLNPEKTKVIIFSRSYLAGKPEPTLKLYGERFKIYPQVKFLRISFDSKFTFKKHFEDILGRCNARYHRIRLLTNKKWGPSPSTILQNSTAPEQIYSACPAFTKIHQC